MEKIKKELKQEYEIDSDNEDNSKDSDQKNSHSSRNLRKKIVKPPQPKVI